MKNEHAALTSSARLPSLLRAWGSSAAWALGCLGSCGLLWQWASENNAFEFGDPGQDHLLLLTLAVLAATVLFHTQAYRKFQQDYFTREASWPPPSSLAYAWAFGLGLLRAGWLLAAFSLGLMLLFKGSNTDAGWR